MARAVLRSTLAVAAWLLLPSYIELSSGERGIHGKHRSDSVGSVGEEDQQNLLESRHVHKHTPAKTLSMDDPQGSPSPLRAEAQQSEARSTDHDEHHGEHDYTRGDLDFATGLLVTACLVPTVVLFAMSGGALGAMTLKLLDVFVSIFLAAIWYSVFDQAIVTFNIRDQFCFAEEVFLFCIVMILSAGACGMCYMLRHRPSTMVAFAGCAGHFIAFAGVGMTDRATSRLAKAPWNPAPRAVSFIVCISAVAMFWCVSVIIWIVWLQYVEHHELQEAIEEMQLDTMCLVLTFLVVQAFRHLVFGMYPPLDHHESMRQIAHQDNFSLIMLGWVLALVALGCLLLPRVRSICRSHFQIHFCKLAIIMIIAWSYLLLFDVVFYFYSAFNGVFCEELFSSLTTFIALLLIFVVVQVEARAGGWSADAKETRNLAITGIALTAAWSWEHCYADAFNVVGKAYQTGCKGLVPKLALGVAIPAFMLPPYLLHIKAVVLENNKAEAASRHGHGHTHEEGESRQKPADSH